MAASCSCDQKVNLEDFETLAILGRGDVGIVYLVRSRVNMELYAMKVLNKEEMRKRDKLKRIFTEREILATAEHPFIVTFYHSFQNKDNIYFVMEYCAGGSFFRTLKRQPGKRLPEAIARFYASEVLLALEYLHALGFIYRDLKPENILLHASGHIMLTDFDLSKKSKVTQEDLEPHYVTNSFVGTAEYLAPEVVKCSGHSGSVDWWTLGILIYEMLLGTTPFVGASQEATFANIVSSKLHFPKEPRLSKHARDLISRLLHPEVSKRLGSKLGAAEIKKHPWFAGCKFALIRQQEPPFIPRLRRSDDLRYFPKIKFDKPSSSEKSKTESWSFPDSSH